MVWVLVNMRGYVVVSHFILHTLYDALGNRFHSLSPSNSFDGTYVPICDVFLLNCLLLLSFESMSHIFNINVLLRIFHTSFFFQYVAIPFVSFKVLFPEEQF